MWSFITLECPKIVEELIVKCDVMWLWWSDMVDKCDGVCWEILVFGVAAYFELVLAGVDVRRLLQC